MPHIYPIEHCFCVSSRMKRARDDGDVITSGSAAMGDDGDSRSYPNHGGGDDDEKAEQEERRQRAIACDVLLSLSLSSWPSSSSNRTSCSVQQNDHAAGTAPAPPPNKPRRRRRRRGTDEEFECQTCGRRFPTFQALGGHRTSHLRRPAATKKNPRSKVVHACAMCGLGFSTGQALGGHMRRHRLGRADTAGSDDEDLMQIIVNGRPTSTSTSLKLLNLFV